MNWIERAHRLLIEFLLIAFLFLTAYRYIGNFKALFFSGVLAHTLSALLNGHIFAMCNHDLFWFGLYKNKNKFMAYIDGIDRRFKRNNPKCLMGIIFFGSLARGVYRETSDLDIRFIADDGLWNAFRASHFVFLERLRAFFARFPIDIYMVSTEEEVRKKIDAGNEPPVFIYKKGNKLDLMFPGSRPYETFKKQFNA